MKTKVKKALHLKTIEELESELKLTQEQLRVLRLDHTMGKVKNTSEIGNKKNAIAVLQTILAEKISIENIKKADNEKGGAK